MIADAIGELVPDAQRARDPARHRGAAPMFCADRCVISSLGEATDLALSFPADRRGGGGGHLPRLVGRPAGDRDRPGRAADRQLQVCDWVLPLPADTLLGRGQRGRRRHRLRAGSRPPVAAAGYDGDVEVEIFNAVVWDAPPDETAATVVERFRRRPRRLSPGG